MINHKLEFQDSLERFVIAQDACYAAVIQELRDEQKRSHWMWFIFPQLAGLGHSEYAKYYGLKDIEEGKRYLQHPILGHRYQECLQLLEVAKSSADGILGKIDAKKLQSSLTIFLEAEPDSPLLNSVLDKFFSGAKDQATLTLCEP
jgi:uncharacterized protein (DUF1810 family)